MRKMKRLNYQLFVTLLFIAIGSTIAFGIILPISMRCFFDNKIYNSILQTQSDLDFDNIKQNNIEQDIYHILYNDLNGEINKKIDEEIDEKLLHQRLMYKEFFKNIQERVLTEQKPISMYKYAQGNEIIYYVINKTYPDNTLISYKIDNSNETLLRQLFTNVITIVAITLSIILFIFLKWNTRFINNLKDIQLKLDDIGEKNLQHVIKSDHYTVEFQDVMHALERMRQRLYENEQVKQDMIHNISHDLKTPLAVIKNYSEGIIDGVYPYGSVEETAHVIYNQANRLQKRVQELLYLNKLEYIKSQKEIPRKFDMSELVLEVVAYMKDTKKIEMNLEKCYFLGDVEKWRVVLENLIDNAKRYAKNQIIIKVQAEKLTIYNDGEPIEASMKGSLFKPFEVGQGGVTGLGLSIVKKTIELYNYDIDFANEHQGGVTFSIYKKDVREKNLLG